MNNENCKRIQAAVKSAGDDLKDRLPTLPNHPERNSYAHVWRSIKEHFGRTYKECDDSDVKAMLTLIEDLRRNPK